MLALEGQNEREQVNRERCNPEKRAYRNLLRDLIGGGDQERRGAGGKPQPEQNSETSRPLHVVAAPRLAYRTSGAVPPRGPRAEHGEHNIGARPDPALRSQTKEWLHKEWITQKGEERSEI